MDEEDEGIEEGEDADPARGSRSEARFPLAFDANGNPLELPPHAVGWRVRRGGGRRGRPRHVFNADTGRQLEIPLGAGLDDLIEAGCAPDRYLLYPIDAGGNIIPGLIAVTELAAGELEEDQQQPASVEQGAVSALLAALKDKQGTIDQQQETARHMATCLTRCFEAAVGGYGRVRALPDPPLIIEQPAAPPPQTTQEQMGEYLKIGKTIFDMLQAAGVVGGGAAPAQGGGP